MKDQGASLTMVTSALLFLEQGSMLLVLRSDNNRVGCRGPNILILYISSILFPFSEETSVWILSTTADSGTGWSSSTTADAGTWWNSSTTPV
ncbi:hypothetical protein O181_034614 [Austropuccinia psidii MF-1]|uniref:Uncharacterized protein n=1 Tax=Austropuccinia psidii MF-1 TaxID=1389203 RepID=A0A9Q3D144_9BASI|nr:hypothetical protein [Austropuccinia psidii MF-1]